MCIRDRLSISPPVLRSYPPFHRLPSSAHFAFNLFLNYRSLDTMSPHSVMYPIGVSTVRVIRLQKTKIVVKTREFVRGERVGGDWLGEERASLQTLQRSPKNHMKLLYDNQTIVWPYRVVRQLVQRIQWCILIIERYQYLNVPVIFSPFHTMKQ